MNSKVIGAIVLLVAVGGGAAWWFLGRSEQEGSNVGLFGRETVTLEGLIGSEKSLYLDNPGVKDLLKNRFGFVIDYTRVGSVEQVQTERIGTSSFLWPSSQVSLDLFKIWNPGRSHKAEVIFNTPIVIFSWDRVTDALVAQGIVQETEGAYYIVDFPKLVALIQEEKTWVDIGLGQIFGKINVIPTDPTLSNSGNLFAGLLANMLVGGEVAQESDLQTILPQIKRFFARQGFMEHSTGFLFEQFINKGMGSYPMIVGYENQLAEFSLQNPQVWERVKNRLRVLYPVPTVWSSHTLITLNAEAHPLIEALQSPEAQQIAWEKHGFRSGVVGIVNDPKIFQFSGLPEEITAVMPLPSGAVMAKITEALQNTTQGE